MTKVQNTTSDQWCDACGNAGWVTLLGTITEHGHTYSRGATPCRWCEQGTNAYLPWLKRDEHARPVSSYEWSDIDPVGPRSSRPAPPERAKFHIARLAATARAVQSRASEFKARPPRETGILIFTAAEKQLINERIIQATGALAENETAA